MLVAYNHTLQFHLIESQYENINDTGERTESKIIFTFVKITYHLKMLLFIIVIFSMIFNGM